MTFQRARSDFQIQDRINEITAATAQIFDESGYDGVTFSAISKLTRFTRPTIYKYFSTKEEILLKILSGDIATWVNELLDSFKINKIYDSLEVSKIWARTLARQERMNELHSILFTILEKNSALAAITEFKKQMYESGGAMANLLRQLYPDASPDQLQSFVMTQYSLAIGFYPMCHLSAIQLEAMQAVSPQYQPANFQEEYQKALYHILVSLEKSA